VSDHDGKTGSVGQIDVEPFDGRDEAAHRKDACRLRAPRSERQRVAHHSTLREASDHGPVDGYPALLEQPIKPFRQNGEGLVEGLLVREPDAIELVPVPSSGREVQQSPRRDPQQLPLGIEHVEQREEVLLTRSPAVKEK
jgi:hypothetical protein